MKKIFTSYSRIASLMLCFSFAQFTNAQNIYLVDSAHTGMTSSTPVMTVNAAAWNNATGSLQAALSAAATTGGQVWVKRGTYYPSANPDGCTNCNTSRDRAFQLKNNVAIYGGFAGTETALSQRNFFTNLTYLSGNIGSTSTNTDNTYHVVVSVANNASAVLDGFYIINGNADGYGAIILSGLNIQQSSGAGMYNANTSPTISNCLFNDNASSSSGAGMYNVGSSPVITGSRFAGNISSLPTPGNNASFDGGGMCNVSSSPVISFSAFAGNYAAGNGGGIFNSASTVSITNCLFALNRGFGGGAIANVGSTVTINRCGFFANNASSGGGAIHNNNASPVTITNSAFTFNTSSQGGAIYNNSSAPTISNSTLYTANGTGSWSIYNSNSNPVVTNSIIWSMNGGSGIDNQSSAPVISYSIVKGGYSGTANLNADPLFVNMGNPAGVDSLLGTPDDGLQLQSCSPAINAGNNAAASLPVDLILAGRINGGTVDLGAYEYYGAGCIILPLTLLRFDGKAINTSDAQLNWRTANEVNTAFFEIQRSKDGRNFTTIGSVQAKGGANNETDYSFDDKSLAQGAYYYRLHMIDRDGKATYSQVIGVSFKNTASFTLYPVPAKDVIWIRNSTTATDMIGKNLQLTDMQGRVLRILPIAQWPQRVDISTLSSGNYLIKLPNETILKLVKQ